MCIRDSERDIVRRARRRAWYRHDGRERLLEVGKDARRARAGCRRGWARLSWTSRRAPSLLASAPSRPFRRPADGAVGPTAKPVSARPAAASRQILLNRDPGGRAGSTNGASPVAHPGGGRSTPDASSWDSRCATPRPVLRPRVGTRRGRVSPCLLYTSPSPRDRTRSRMPSSA